MPQLLDPDDYTVAWIAASPVEVEAALAALDIRHEGRFESTRGDNYVFIGGEINTHKIIIATYPKGQNFGTNSAAALASQVKKRFENIWITLVVGIATGLPNLNDNDPERVRDIRLGDVLVAAPRKTSTGIIQYDQGVRDDNGFHVIARPAETLALVRSAMVNIEVIEDRPFKKNHKFANYLKDLQEKAKDEKFQCPCQDKDELFHQPTDSAAAQLCSRVLRDESERTRIWYGNIGSGNTLMRDASKRDELRDEHNLIGLDMVSAGVMGIFPAGVVLGVCDYGDAHTSEDWQPYAAAVAAVYAKGILYTIHTRPKKRRIEVTEVSRPDRDEKHKRAKTSHAMLRSSHSLGKALE